MNVDTTQFRRAHTTLGDRAAELRDAARDFPTLPIAERKIAHNRIVSWLRECVEPHTRLDEWLLYPAVAEQLGDPLIGASMNYDHLAIRDWIDRLAVADPRDTAEIQQLLYGLDALIRVHIWKEDTIFIETLESPSWPRAAPRPQPGATPRDRSP
jgi:hemerythrin HHE cation binding domain-containing protein